MPGNPLQVFQHAVGLHDRGRLLEAEQLYREVRALRIYEGTSEIQKLIIANQVLKADNGSS